MKQYNVIRIYTPIGFFDIKSNRYSTVFRKIRELIKTYDLSYVTLSAMDDMMYQIILAYVDVSTDIDGNNVIRIRETKAFNEYIKL